ncbi:hypothetical protein F2Q69_00025314 [Brassica cretica]|uniref:Uncharacterized protein n=1 Tax=Brassica cretica TaxID=69181 RepID=A0A8S9Q7N8_BRACR|nr:hypothetical protein F2Q69_00025314 [Brassica cretica]
MVETRGSEGPRVVGDRGRSAVEDVHPAVQPRSAAGTRLGRGGEVSVRSVELRSELRRRRRRRVRRVGRIQKLLDAIRLRSGAVGQSSGGFSAA